MANRSDTLNVSSMSTNWHSRHARAENIKDHTLYLNQKDNLTKASEIFVPFKK